MFQISALDAHEKERRRRREFPSHTQLIVVFVLELLMVSSRRDCLVVVDLLYCVCFCVRGRVCVVLLCACVCVRVCACVRACMNPEIETFPDAEYIGDSPLHNSTTHLIVGKSSATEKYLCALARGIW